MGKFASRLHCFGDVTRSHPTTDAKGPFPQAIFAAIFLLLMHAIEWIHLRIYQTICGKAI